LTLYTGADLARRKSPDWMRHPTIQRPETPPEIEALMASVGPQAFGLTKRPPVEISH
jgi:hypothetical protein